MEPIVTWWPNLLDPNGREEVLDSWTVLFDRFERIVPFAGDNVHAGWSPARFSPCERGKDNVSRVSAICLDYDAGTSLEAARELWRPYFGLIHTSRKHTSDLHRFRVILPLARTVSPFEFGELWKRVNHHAGGTLDPAPKDPSRFWYVPGVGDQPGAEYQAIRLTGKPLDPDSWLARPLPVPRNVGELPKVTGVDHPYLKAAVEDEKYALNRATEGDRNAQLNRSAFALGTFVGGGVLTEALVISELRPVAIAIGLTQSETDRTLASGIESGKKHPRGIPASTLAPRQETPKSTVGSESTPDPESAQTQPAPKPVGRVLTVRELLQQSGERALKRERLDTLTTGHWRIDDTTGGFKPGFVWVIGADTSWGKSSLLVMIADENIKRGRRVLIVSGEDDESLYGDRLLVRRARVDYKSFRRGRMTREDEQIVRVQMAKGEDVPVYLDARGRSIEKTCESIARIIKDAAIDLVALDYVQAFDNDRQQQDKRNQITYIARKFTDTIKTAGKAGIIFSQITKSSPEKRHPDKHSIRDSRDVSNAAEVVLLGFEPEKAITDRNGGLLVAQGQKCMLLDKCKDGPRGGFYPMQWNPISACFDVTADPEMQRVERIIRDEGEDSMFDNEQPGYS